AQCVTICVKVRIKIQSIKHLVIWREYEKEKSPREQAALSQGILTFLVIAMSYVISLNQCDVVVGGQIYGLPLTAWVISVTTNLPMPTLKCSALIKLYTQQESVTEHSLTNWGCQQPIRHE